ncbi:unnamed protein product [Vicia faba]|uniref:Uncharacterized protein n=1 Tax=Vicia faba TaxID=3906 RepID=A0AAV0Z979_VICFA|nr:unnamed protein product [Vicia faba]
MSPPNFPLRWESTGDQWWYASPIDWAAANGHYDLVREMLRIDSNNLFKLTSLRRIRRLEVVWDDDEELFNNVAKFRSQIAHKLLLESESKKGKNSLIRSGYGGWLMYTAASAGDVNFVQILLERNPLLVFGEGEYGVTDILYAAARSKNCEVFRLLFDYAVSPRFVNGRNGIVGEIPHVYRLEMINRAVHAAARGGNLKILEDLLANSDDILAFRDAHGSTVLHAAAARGKLEVVKYLASSFNIILNSTDHQGNTALHIAASRGQLSAANALIASSPSLISQRNNSGATFLHKAVSGFQTPAFRRFDRQVELLRNLLTTNRFHIEHIINLKNNDGRTALHMAIIDILIKKLLSAGGMFSFRGHDSRKAIASHLRMQSNIGTSPGTMFRLQDSEIFLYTGIENVLSNHHRGIIGASNSSSSENIPYEPSTNESSSKKISSVNYAASRLKKALQWSTKTKEKKKVERSKKLSNDEVSLDSSCKKLSTNSVDEVSLRQRFSSASSSKPNTIPTNKRTLSVRSYQSSPNAKKRFASGRSRSSSFSKSSFSSPKSFDYKQKGVYIDHNEIVAGPSCLNQQLPRHDDDNGDESPKLVKKNSVSRKLKGHYFCFGAPGLNVKNSVHKASAVAVA